MKGDNPLVDFELRPRGDGRCDLFVNGHDLTSAVRLVQVFIDEGGTPDVSLVLRPGVSLRVPADLLMYVENPVAEIDAVAKTALEGYQRLLEIQKNVAVAQVAEGQGDTESVKKRLSVIGRLADLSRPAGDVGPAKPAMTDVWITPYDWSL